MFLLYHTWASLKQIINSVNLFCKHLAGKGPCRVSRPVWVWSIKSLLRQVPVIKTLNFHTKEAQFVSGTLVTRGSAPGSRQIESLNKHERQHQRRQGCVPYSDMPPDWAFRLCYIEIQHLFDDDIGVVPATVKCPPILPVSTRFVNFWFRTNKILFLGPILPNIDF